MNVELLRAVGEALYGSRWQHELAAALDVNERTVRRWVSGATPVPAFLASALFRLVLDRTATLDELLDQLRPIASRP